MVPKIRLVIADVDGTLVTQEKILTPKSIEAVKRMRAAGIRFTITSGRPPLGMQMLVEPLALTDPIAAFNGGVVVRPDMSVISRSVLPRPVSEKVMETILQHGLDCWIYTETEWLVRDPQAPHVAREQWTVKFPPKVVSDLTPYLDHVVKIVGVSDDLPLVARCEADVQRDLAGQASAARSQPYYLDVTNPDANKGHVVKVMSELLSVPPSEIATLGDMPNDVLMFKVSGMSIAMGNASAEVQKQATYVTASNEQDGFALAVEKYILSDN